MDTIQLQAAQGVAKVPRLYDLRAVDIATFISSIFAGAFLISRNFAALGDDDAARRTLVLGFLGLLPLAFLLILVPSSPKYDDLTRLAFQLGQAGIIHFAAVKVQGEALSKHRESGGLFYSRWRAAGISLLLLVLVLPILLGMLFFAARMLHRAI